jgi:hypothetical protein
MAVKIFPIVASALLVVSACSSDDSSGNAAGAAGNGQGGTTAAGSGGAAGQGNTGGSSAGTGGAGTGGSGTDGSAAGGAAGTGGGGVGGGAGAAGTAGGGTATGSGGAREGGAAEAGLGGGMQRDASVGATADAIADVEIHDGAVAANGSYARTGWTGAYTCTGTCLAGNGDSPNDAPPLAFDGDYQSRWSTNRLQQDFVNAVPTQFPLYFTVDLKQVMNVSRVTMHPSCRDIFDAPGQLDVLLSVDGTNFTTVVMNHRPAVPTAGEVCPPAANAVATDSITFTRAPARFIRLKATQSVVQAHPGSGDRYWAIGEFFAYP